MGESGWARIEIGGRAPRQGLARALALDVDDLDKLVAGEEVKNVQVRQEDGLLVIEDDQAWYARFDDIEGEMEILGVAFERSSGMTASFGESRRSFRPGARLPSVVTPDIDVEHSEEDGGWMVSVETIRELLDEGGETRLRQWLDEKYPVIPALEPIQLYDDKDDPDYEEKVIDNDGVVDG